MSKRIIFFSLLGMLLAPALTSGQGVLVDLHEARRYRLPRPIVQPRPPSRTIPQGPYKIKELSVNARITDQVAKVQVRSRL